MRWVETVLVCGVVGLACASPAPFPPEVIAARSAIDAAQTEGGLAENAPARLERAKESVRLAEVAFRKGGEPEEVSHLAQIGAAQIKIAREEASEREARRGYDTLSRRVSGLSASLRLRDAENTALVRQLRSQTTAPPLRAENPPSAPLPPTVIVLSGTPSTAWPASDLSPGRELDTVVQSERIGRGSMLSDLEILDRRAREQESSLEERQRQLEAKAQQLLSQRDESIRQETEIAMQTQGDAQRAIELEKTNARIREVRVFAEEQKEQRLVAQARADALEAKIAELARQASLASVVVDRVPEKEAAVPALREAPVVAVEKREVQPSLDTPLEANKSALAESVDSAENKERIAELTEDLNTSVALADRRVAALEVEKQRVRELELENVRLSTERDLLSGQVGLANVAASRDDRPTAQFRQTQPAVSTAQEARLIELEGALEAARSENRTADARERDLEKRTRNMQRELANREDRGTQPQVERSSGFRWPWSSDPENVRRRKIRRPRTDPAGLETAQLVQPGEAVAASQPATTPDPKLLDVRAEQVSTKANAETGSGEALEAQQVAMALRSERALLKEWNATLTKRGTVFTLEDAFASNQTTLKSKAVEQLGRLAEVLNERPSRTVSIEAHTDSAGKDEYNLSLSNRRAEAVRDFLVARGLSEQRLISRGYGEQRPISPNNNDSGRERNRRVELVLADAVEASEAS